MTKAEFKRLIHEAEVELGERYRDGHLGVCIALKYAHSFLGGKRERINKLPVTVLFKKITKPDDVECGYWFGSLFDEHNRHVRMIALRLFEQYVLSEKLYLEL